MTELPQYHFNRDDFVRVWYGVLDDSATIDVLEWFKCSICGGESHWQDFCPNCGADMRGGKK